MKGLQITGLSVATATETLVEPVDVRLQPGRPLTLLGETGSGKSAGAGDYGDIAAVAAGQR